jgi:hypothetical protein
LAVAFAKGITDFERVLELTGTDTNAVKPDSKPEGVGKLENRRRTLEWCFPIMALSLRLRVSTNTNLGLTQGRGSPLAAGAKLRVLS